MSNKLKEIIEKNISGKKVLFLFVLSNVVYMVMLIFTIPNVMKFSGGMKLLDMMPTGYSVEYVNALLEKLGSSGREAYLLRQLPVDMVYPVLFGISNCLLLAYILNKLGKLKSNYFYLCFIPLFSGLFDYGENIGIIAILNTYPDNAIVLTQITNVFSIFKSAFTTTYFIILLIFLVVWGAGTLFQKR